MFALEWLQHYPGPMKVRNVLKRIEDDECYWQFKRPEKRGRVTIAGYSSQKMDKDILNSILKQAGLK
jgi:HicA toxin of bacterial toxin-antitoxin,